MRVLITYDKLDDNIYEYQEERLHGIGLKRVYDTTGDYQYEVFDKQLFFLSVIKYDIEFKEIKCSL
jgi:hypothetical protein